MYSGAPYLPIDPSFPPARINRLLDNGRQLVLTHRGSSKDRVARRSRTLSVDPESADDAPQRRDPVQQPDDLAYVIYTSGSTGQPKGVAIEHRAALNTIVDINGRFEIGAGDRVFALSSLSFDLSVNDIFGPLSVGGAIVMPRGESVRDPSKWIPMLSAAGVTVWNSAPALMEMLIEYIADRPGMLPDTLRVVMLSGDWIPLPLAERIRELVPNARVYSLGGATEASIWSIYHPIGEIDPAWKSIPYGKPLANQQVMVVDSALEPRPTWVIGDLYIGGAGLARGYWRDEEKTVAAFVTHPATGARLYRTGDLGRYLPDGNIELLGRNDNQIKVRGHRIELEEIESVLERHTGIRMSAVLAVGDNSSNRRLVAYVTLERVHGDDQMDAAATADLWDALVRAGHQQEASPEAQAHEEVQEAILDELDRLTPHYAMRTLAMLGLFRDPGERYSHEEVLAKAHIVDGYSRLIDRWLNHLAADGLLAAEDGTFRLAKLPEETEVAPAWERVRKSGLFEDAIWEQLRGWFDHLPEVLSGLKSPLELLFPGGSSTLATEVYQQNRYVHQISAAVFACLECPRTLRVLEVGAGTCGTTVFVLPALPRGKTHYFLTDISPFFITQARKRFADQDLITYGVLNVENPPPLQGFAEHGFDAILGGNVVHGVKDVREALRNIRAMLAPGGIVVLEESTRWRRVFDITVGLIEGINRFADDRGGDNAPFMSVDWWRSAFRESGFERFAAFPESPQAGTHVLVAAAGAVRPPGDTHVPLDSDMLRNFARKHLPEYMVPSAFVVLDDFPLSSNGKVDRKALPIPDVSLRAASQVYIAPVTRLQQAIAAIWSGGARRNRDWYQRQFLRDWRRLADGGANRRSRPR